VGRSYAGGLWASAGSAGEVGGAITWMGDVSAGEPFVVRFLATVEGPLSAPRVVVNWAWIDDGEELLVREATIVAGGYGTYLPLAAR